MLRFETQEANMVFANLMMQVWPLGWELTHHFNELAQPIAQIVATGRQVGIPDPLYAMLAPIGKRFTVYGQGGILLDGFAGVYRSLPFVVAAVGCAASSETSMVYVSGKDKDNFQKTLAPREDLN